MKSIDSKEAAFMGRITAGFTHEMKNVLAIIKESAGLMEDLLCLTQEGSFPQRERLFRVLNKILEQVQRGVDLSTRLNRFAHSPDESITIVDLNEVGDQVAVLSERFARLKGVTLRMESSGEKLPVRTSPVGMLMALFVGMESLWDCMKAGNELRLVGERRGDEAVLHVCAHGDTEEEDLVELSSRVRSSGKWAGLQEIVATLEGNLEWGSDGAGFSLVFPMAIP